MNSIDLKIIRENRNMTQKEAAIKLNVSRTLLYKYENCLSIPPDDIIKSMACIYDLPEDYLRSVVQKDHYLNERVAAMTDQIDSFRSLISREITDRIISDRDLNEMFEFKLHLLRRCYTKCIFKIIVLSIICLILICLSGVFILRTNNTFEDKVSSSKISDGDDILIVTDDVKTAFVDVVSQKR